MANAENSPEVVAIAETPDDGIVAGFEDRATRTVETDDSLTFSNGVIEKIVATACQGVEGVVGMKGGFYNRLQETFTGAAPTKGVEVEVMQDSSVRLNISIVMEYGAYAPSVFERVREAAIRELGRMTGLVVSGVNLRIEDVVQVENDPLAELEA